MGDGGVRAAWRLRSAAPIRGAGRAEPDHDIVNFKSQMESAHSAAPCPDASQNPPKVDFLRVLFSVHFSDPLFRASGGSRSGPKRVKVPPWRSLGGSLAAFGRIWPAFGVHFEGHLLFNFHYFSGRPQTLILNDLMVLFEV